MQLLSIIKMHAYNYLIYGMSFAFAAAVQPGPLQTYIISQTLKIGWRGALPAALAPLISDGPIIALVLMLLNILPGYFMVGLRLGGGVFLVYLAVTAYKSWKGLDGGKIVSETSQGQTLLKASLINMLNPAPYLSWSLIMGPLFLEGWDLAPGNGVALLAGFYFTFTSTLAGIIFLFSFARRLGPKVSRGMLGLSALILFVFGVCQLWVAGRLLFNA